MVDDGDREEDAGAGADGTHEVGDDREGADAHAAKGGGRGDVPVQDVDNGGITVALHYHLGIAQLLGHIPGGSARDLNPGLGEERAGREDEDEIEDGVEGVVDDLGDGGGGANVVRDASDGDDVATSLGVLPFSQETDKDIGGGTVVEKLGDEVEVGVQGSLEDDGHVGGVEQLDGVGAGLSAVLLILDWEVDPPSLEVDDNEEDEDGRGQVGQVGEVLAHQGLLDGADLVVAGDEKVEEGDDGALELGAAPGVECGRTESLPADILADVSGDEEGDTAAKTVALLQKLVEGENDETGTEELGDDEEGIAGADGAQVAVHAAHNVGDGLTHGNEDSEELLGALKKGAVLLDVVVDLDDAGSGEQLHDQAGRDDGTDAELHEGTAVGGEDHAHPVEGVGRLRILYAVDGDLAAHQEDEQGDGGPKDFLTEGDLWRQGKGGCISYRRSARKIAKRGEHHLDSSKKGGRTDASLPPFLGPVCPLLGTLRSNSNDRGQDARKIVLIPT